MQAKGVNRHGSRGAGQDLDFGWVFGGNPTKGNDINYIGERIPASLILKNEEPTFRVLSVQLPLYESTTLKAESPVYMPPPSSNRAATASISPLDDFRP